MVTPVMAEPGYTPSQPPPPGVTIVDVVQWLPVPAESVVIGETVAIPTTTVAPVVPGTTEAVVDTGADVTVAATEAAVDVNVDDTIVPLDVDVVSDVGTDVVADVVSVDVNVTVDDTIVPLDVDVVSDVGDTGDTAVVQTPDDGGAIPVDNGGGAGDTEDAKTNPQTGVSPQTSDKNVIPFVILANIALGTAISVFITIKKRREAK